MRKAVTVVAILAILAATILYSLMAHQLTANDDRSEFSYVFALASLYFVAICLAIGSRWRFALIVVASIAVLVGWIYRESLFWDPRWVYLLQHVGANIGLGLLFGLSLRSAKGSLVTRMAKIAHGGHLPPRVERYTGQVTLAWTLFFAAMSLVSIALFVLGPPLWWSVFINFLSFPLVILMFLAEYAFRLFHIRDFEHKSILEGIRSYSKLGQRDSPR